MIIGNGMIAKRFSRFADDADRLVFASGVSNSSNIDEAAFNREFNLLIKKANEHPLATLIYFSTCSIYDPSLQQSAYVLHKIKMEALVKTIAKSYIIFRVSNPVGFTENKNTLLNYFVERIKSNAHFALWEYASRNLIDIDDMFALCQAMITNPKWLNKIINVANPVNYPVTTIVEAVENHFSLKANYELIEKGNSPLIDTSDIQSLYDSLHIEFTKDYLPTLLKKYYPY